MGCAMLVALSLSFLISKLGEQPMPCLPPGLLWLRWVRWAGWAARSEVDGAHWPGDMPGSEAPQPIFPQKKENDVPWPGIAGEPALLGATNSVRPGVVWGCGMGLCLLCVCVAYVVCVSV